MNAKFKTLICKASKDTDGTITAVASTPDVDRYGDVVAPSWDLAAFKANPVIMHGHDYDGPVVGRALEIELVGESLMMSVEFDESDTNPVGQRIANQFRSGFMSAFSVGFAPGKSTPRADLPKDHPAYVEKGAGQYFENNQLLEVSAVAIPANPHALAVRAKRWGLEVDNKNAPAPEVTKASAGIAAPEGHHWMDYEGGPVLMAGEDPQHPGASAVFEFEIVEEHDPERLKPEYQDDEAPPEAETEEERYGYDDEDEEKAQTLRSIVRSELLALMGDQNDEPAQRAIDWFTDSQPANESDDFAALFNEAE